MFCLNPNIPVNHIIHRAGRHRLTPQRDGIRRSRWRAARHDRAPPAADRDRRGCTGCCASSSSRIGAWKKSRDSAEADRIVAPLATLFSTLFVEDASPRALTSISMVPTSTESRNVRFGQHARPSVLLRPSAARSPSIVQRQEPPGIDYHRRTRPGDSCTRELTSATIARPGRAQAHQPTGTGPQIPGYWKRMARSALKCWQQITPAEMPKLPAAQQHGLPPYRRPGRVPPGPSMRPAPSNSPMMPTAPMQLRRPVGIGNSPETHVQIPSTSIPAILRLPARRVGMCPKFASSERFSHNHKRSRVRWPGTPKFLNSRSPVVATARSFP